MTGALQVLISPIPPLACGVAHWKKRAAARDIIEQTTPADKEIVLMMITENSVGLSKLLPDKITGLWLLDYPGWVGVGSWQRNERSAKGTTEGAAFLASKAWWSGAFSADLAK